MSAAVRAPSPVVWVDLSTLTVISSKGTGNASSGGQGWVTTGGSSGSGVVSSTVKGAGTSSAHTAPAKRATPSRAAIIDPKITVWRCCSRLRRWARARAASCAGESFTTYPFANGPGRLHRIVPDDGANCLKFQDPGVEDIALGEGGAQGAVHPAFEVHHPLVQDDVGEEVAEEGGIFGQERAEIKLRLGGHEFVEAHLPGRDVGPITGRVPAVVGVG